MNIEDFYIHKLTLAKDVNCDRLISVSSDSTVVSGWLRITWTTWNFQVLHPFTPFPLPHPQEQDSYANANT